MALVVKTVPAHTRDPSSIPVLGLEKGTATHSSILAWRIPWTEEPGRIQSMGSQRVGHDGTDVHMQLFLQREFS